MEEQWKDIKGYEGLYQVSNYGKVKRLEHKECNSIQEVRILPERILKQTFNFRGYLKVGLSKDNKTKHVFVHRLVAGAFIDNPNNYPQVNHKDEDKTNNCVDNLEWCTNLYNANYGTRRKQKLSNKLKRYWERKKQEVVEDGNVD